MKYFAWLLRVRRFWCSFGRVKLGILYFLVNRTSSVFSGLMLTVVLLHGF